MKITSFLNFNKIDKSEKKVKVNSDSNDKNNFESLGIEKNKENLKIYKTLKDNNVNPTKGMIEDIKDSFNKLEGSLEDKINTLDVLLKKDIEVNFKNIKVVHTYLNKEMDYKSIFNHLSKYFEGEKVDYNKLFKALGLSEGFVKEFMQNLEKNMILSENLKSILDNTKIKVGENDIKFIKDILEIKEEIVLVEENEETENSENQIEFLEDFQDNIDQVIEELEGDILIEDIPLDIVKTDNFRKFIVEKTSIKMSEVKDKFEAFKKENIKILDRVLETDNIKDKENNLKKLIKNFEKVIMKSDITLYTSMSEEKELIQMSSKLELAKEYINKNELVKSKNILKEIKKSLDKIEFEPKDIKVKAFMKDEANKILFNEKGKLNNIYNKLSKENKGPRDQLEILRSMGINHESEAIQNMEKGISKNIEMNNLKNMLLSITRNSVNNENLPIEENVDKITGNQLLNKLEGKSNIQQINLTIPYMQEDKIRSLDLYVNSKKENEKIDWKNSTLYFVVNLNKYGKTGIKISSANKVININIKNDKSEFKKHTKGLFNSFLDELSDEGFLRGRVSFSKFNEKNNKGEMKEKRGVNLSEKGFDIKI